MADKQKKSGKAEKSSAAFSSDTARKIWLAGIGAYGRAFSEAQDSLSKVSASTSRVFDDLVNKGEVIETMVAAKGKKAANEVMGKVSSVSGGLDVDERIQKMRARLHLGTGGEAEDIAARLDAIEAKLDKVLAMLEPKTPAKKPAAKKPAAKKPVKKTAAKSSRTKK